MSRATLADLPARQPAPSITTRGARAGATLVLWALATGPTAARADGVPAAAEAFARAQRLSLEGKMAEAADLYELADELAPSAAALRNATRARFAAGHKAMAATDAAALLRRYPDDAAAREVAEAVLSELVPQLARVDVACDAPCAVVIGDKAASRQRATSHALFVTPGARTVGAVFDAGSAPNQQVSLRAGTHVALRFEAPAASVTVASPPAATRAGDDRGGLSRGWVLSGAVLTVGLGAAATYQGLRTLEDRDQIRDLVAAGDRAAADRRYAEAEDRQRWTNALLIGTAAAGLATLTAAVFTRWSSPERPTVALTPLTGGAAVGFTTPF